MAAPSAQENQNVRISSKHNLHNTTIWGANFYFGAFLACDTRSTTLFDRKRKVNNDEFQKFFYITEDIMVIAAGRVRIVKMAIGALRNMARNFDGPKKVNLEYLLRSFMKNSSKEFSTLIKKLIDERDADGEGCRLILSSCTMGSFYTPDITLACINIKEKVRSSGLRIMDKSASKKDICGIGAGSGFSAVSNLLDELTYAATLEEVKVVAKKAFVEASKNDDRTGGSVILFRGTWGSRWQLIEHQSLGSSSDSKQSSSETQPSPAESSEETRSQPSPLCEDDIASSSSDSDSDGAGGGYGEKGGADPKVLPATASSDC